MSAHDTFAVADRALAGHTSGTGQAWAEHPDSTRSLSIVDREVPTPAATGNSIYTLVETPASADYSVSARMTFDDISNVAAGLILRADETASTHYFGVQNLGAWRIIRVVAGTATTIRNVAHSLSDGATGVLKFTASGSTLTLLWNGSEVASVTDSTITAAGRPGIRAALASGASPGYTYHDFRVESTDADGVFFPDLAAVSAGRSGNIWQSLESGRTYGAINTGAWQYISFTGTSIKLVFGARNFATLTTDLEFDVTIDGGTTTRVVFDPDNPVYSVTGLTDTSHTLYFRLAGFYFGANQWSNPNQRIELCAVQVDAGKTLSTPTLKPNRALVFGDSITYGAVSNGVDDNITDYSVAWPGVFASLANADLDTAGYSGMGWVNLTPDFEDSWDFIVDGVPRPFDSADDPDYVLIAHGHNDPNNAALATAVENTLTAIRAALPSTPIYVVHPPTGSKTNIAAGFIAWGDENSTIINLDDYDATLSSDIVANSHDNVHPIEDDHQRIAEALSAALFTGSGYMKTYKIDIDASVASSTLTNYAAEINTLSVGTNVNAGVFATDSGGGADVWFSRDPAGDSPIDAKLVYWSDADSEFAFDVKVASISSTTGATIYMHVGSKPGGYGTNPYEASRAVYLPLTSNFNDATINVRNATGAGGIAAGGTTGPNGVLPATDFDGSDDFVSSDLPAAPTDFFLSLWINQDTEFGTNDSQVNSVFTVAESPGSGSYSPGIAWDGANNRWMGFNFDGSVKKAYTSVVTATGAWQHVAASYDGVNITPYVNGVAGTPVAAGDFSLTYTTPVLAAGVATGARFVNAKMSRLHYGTSPRTAAEINADYLLQGPSAATYWTVTDVSPAFTSPIRRIKYGVGLGLGLGL